MTPQRSVVLSMLLAGLIFGAAGGKVSDVVSRVRGQQVESKPFTAETIFAWGFLFTFLMIGADIPTTGRFTAMMSWLIAMGVAIGFGPAAFYNLQTLTGTKHTAIDKINAGLTDVPTSNAKNNLRGK